MAKLSFVVDLVECITELAQSRVAPLHGFYESVNLKQVNKYSKQINIFDSY